MPYQAKHTRRDILLAGLATSTALNVGCKSKTETADSPVERTDVPLRLLWVGSEQDAATTKRTWEAVAAQPLKITTVALDREHSSGVTQEILEQYKTQDLIVYPLISAAQLVSVGAVTPQSDELLGESITIAAVADAQNQSPPLARVYPVLRSGAARFAGQTIATPLGSNLPAILSVEPAKTLTSWAEYHQWVDEELDGAAAEPNSGGWAGQMFLWRAATEAPSPWLFDSDGLTPLIDQSYYVDVLDQMTKTAKRYNDPLQTPQSIWNGILDGKLRGGIGWEIPGENDGTELSVANLPSAESANRVLLDPFSLIVSISTGCRQSAASTNFIRWISAGEGSESLKGQLAGVTATRNTENEDTRQAQLASQYESWLRRRLSTPLTLPTLQLISGDQYYAALEEQITLCLKGSSQPKNALANVASAWSELNKQVGVKEQERTWRRAQGSRA